MKDKWVVALLAKDTRYLDDVLDYIKYAIEKDNENIIYFQISTDTFEIETGRNIYKFVSTNKDIKGCRFNEIFIFDAWAIDKDVLDNLIISTIIKDDTNDFRKNIHYLERN